MGYKATVYTIFGVRIEEEALSVVESVRGCSHEVVEHEFCPQCGKPMWKAEEKDVNAAEMDDELEAQAGKGFRVIDGGTDSDQLFIGVAFERNQNDEPHPVLEDGEIRNIKFQLDKFLGDKFKVEDFGMWTVMRESY